MKPHYKDYYPKKPRPLSSSSSQIRVDQEKVKIQKQELPESLQLIHESLDQQHALLLFMINTNA